MGTDYKSRNQVTQTLWHVAFDAEPRRKHGVSLNQVPPEPPNQFLLAEYTLSQQVTDHYGKDMDRKHDPTTVCNPGHHCWTCSSMAFFDDIRICEEKSKQNEEWFIWQREEPLEGETNRTRIDSSQCRETPTIPSLPHRSDTDGVKTALAS